MDFGNLMNQAKNAASQLGGSGDQKAPQDNGSNPNPNPGADTANAANASVQQKWADVGSSGKAAFTEHQARQARGEGVDYKGLGDIGQKAAAAYNTEGGPKDAVGIGKMISGGFMGGNKQQQAPAQTEGQQPQGEQQPPQQQ